jgi:uncharacterized protein with von Willebrand factor type A (vWA) domain
MTRASYSRWDGTQEVSELSGEDLLGRLLDDLVEHGDLDQALRRLMQGGFTDASGREVAGLRELLENVRRRRAALARRAFADMHASIANVAPEVLERHREMLSELNRMVTRGQAGEDIGGDFARFMERFGDLVPGRPKDLDELLQNLARQLEAARALLEAMTPEQRAQLAELSQALLDANRDFAAELGQMAATLATLGAFGTGSFEGLPEELSSLSVGFGPAGAVTSQLSDLSQLEQLLAAAPSPGALAEVDVDRARQLLGEADARSLGELGKLARRLRDAGLAEQKEGRLRLTPKGLRRTGERALQDLYSRLSPYRHGQHPVGRPGAGHERAGETKPYEWGDAFNLSIGHTLRNSLSRSGPGTPLRLSPEDFEVERTEALSRSATVIMLDLSLSMPMRGNFVAAKKMALALHALISGRFPHDYLGMVGFSRFAREVAFQDLPEVSWDYDWGTNIQHGLALARKLLSRQRGTRQVIMVTDGEPTAHFPPGSHEPVFAYPPTRETVAATLAEVAGCTREGIRVNTFALDAAGHLRRFAEQVARVNQGRVFFTTPAELGDYVLVDFLENRTMRRRRRAV